MSHYCMKDHYHGRCCCNCKSHHADNHHCLTMVRHDDKCVCDRRKGWICSTDGTRMHSGWDAHGMCELYRPKTVVEPEPTDQYALRA